MKTIGKIKTLNSAELSEYLKDVFEGNFDSCFTPSEKISFRDFLKIIRELKKESDWKQLIDWDKVTSGDESFDEVSFLEVILNGYSPSPGNVIVVTLDSTFYDCYFHLDVSDLKEFVCNYEEYISQQMPFIQCTPYVFIFPSDRLFIYIHDEGQRYEIHF